MAVDKVLIEYEAIIKKFDTQMSALEKRMIAVEKAAEKSTKTIEKSFNNVGKSIKKAGAALGIAFTVQKVKDLVIETINLAAKAEGVENAFNRLNRPGLLDQLRKATRGTVSDLKLMETAVRAENFDIPLKNLAKLLEFARRRAQATGESVEFLTQSIVLGIGRKSPLILDNLGISALRLREEIAKGGDFMQAFGAIVDQELSEMGPAIDTTADKLQRVNASWQNIKVSVGEALITMANFFIESFPPLERMEQEFNALTKASKQLGIEFSDLKAFGGGFNEIGKNILNSTELIDQASIAAEKFGVNIDDVLTVTAEGQVSLNDLGKQLIGTLTKLSEIRPISDDAPKTIAFLKEQIKNANDELNKFVTTREQAIPIQKEIAMLEEEIAKILGKETEAEKKLRLAQEKRSKAQKKAADEEQKRREENLKAEKEAVAELDQLNAELIRDETQRRIALADLKREQSILALKDTENKVNLELAINKKFQQEMTDILAEEEANRLEIANEGLGNFQDAQNQLLKEFTGFTQQELDAISIVVNEVLEAIDGVMAEIQKRREIRLEALQGQIAKIGKVLKKETDARIRAVEDRVKKGVISEDEGEKQIQKIRLRQEINEKQIRLREFEVNKEFALKQLEIDTASALVKLLAKGIFGAVQGALILKTAADQKALILSQVPTFAKGTESVEGPGTTTSDSVFARLSKKERVVSADKNQKYWDPLHDVHLDRFHENWIKRGKAVEALKRSESTAANMAASMVLNGFDSYGMEKNQRKAYNQSDKNTDKIVGAIKDGQSDAQFIKNHTW